MNVRDIINCRLSNQQMTAAKFKKPEDLTAWFCGMQAQDFTQAKWAIGLRIPGITDSEIEDVFSKGKILRTHVLRPTWHFVNSVDIRWMLSLTAPRLKALSAGMFRKLELDKKTLDKSCKILRKHLQGGKHLSRTEIIKIFKQEKISMEGLRFSYIMFNAELNGIVCSGAKIGKQLTYALLDERAPDKATFRNEEALAELSKRYFNSHGPAGIQDFIWWSGLTAAQAKIGIEIIKSDLTEIVVADKAYWMNISTANNNTKPISKSPVMQLLPAYDEYVIAYKDRGAVLDTRYTIQTGNGIFSPVIISDGQIIGVWKRTFKKDKVVIEINSFVNLSKVQKKKLENEMKRYADFLSMKLFIENSALQ